MKKHLMRALIFALVLCMVLPMTAMAASTTYIVMSIENDETGGDYYIILDESSRYLTENANLLYEVVQIINENYYGNRKMFNFHSPAMRAIMDEGLKAYGQSDEAWYDYVEKYFESVRPEEGDPDLKAILRDKDSTLGDLIPNVKHSISFKNTVAGDRKYGVTYTVSITRYEGSDGPSDHPEEEKPIVKPDGPAPGLNREDHFAYVKGYPAGDFRPNAYISREEATTIFYRLLTEETRSYYETGAVMFSDVSADRWSCTAISTMASAGIVTGYPDGTFGPSKQVTRAEFAAIAARFDSETYSGPDLFPDIAGHWAAEEINRAAAKGWIMGDENGNFRPNDPITRAEAVTMINRVLERQPETEEDLLDGMIVFTDNMDPDVWYYLAVQEAANGHEYVRKSNGIHETWTALTVTDVE